MSRPLLVLSHYFPPCGSVGGIRTAKWCRYLPEAGWIPHVLAGPAVDADDFGYDQDEVRRIAAAGSLRRVGRAGSLWTQGAEAAARMPAPVRRAMRLAGSPLWATDTKFWWLREALPAARELVRRVRPQAILASFSPVANLVLALKLKEEAGLPVVFDFRDPWTSNAASVYLAPWQRAFEKRQERRMLGRADAVAAATGVMAGDLEAAGARRVVTLPNGYDEADFEGPEPGREPGVWRLAFVGKFYAAMSLGAVAGALASLERGRPRPGPGLRLRVVGGLPPPRREEVARAGFLDGLEDMGPLSHPRAVREMRAADALLLPLWAGPGTAAIHSSKTFEYLRSGRPVLGLAPPGEARDLLTAFGHPVLGPGASPERIREVLKPWVDRTPSTRPPPPELRRYERRTLSLALGSLLEEVCPPPPPYAR